MRPRISPIYLANAAVLLVISLNVCGGIKMIEVQGPSLINSGDTVTLACRYDLGKDALYSMKWYKDDQEIYRYVPTDQPESHVFGVPGVAVNASLSVPHRLVATMVGPHSSGRYRCEITIETPSFITLDVSKNISVVVPPSTPPHIHNLATFYKAGDQVDVRCVSANSKPAAKLEWFLNGIRIQESKWISPTATSVNGSTTLETSESTLRFVASEEHFLNGRLQLSCVASIDKSWQARADDAAVGVLGNVTEQTNHLVISAVSSTSRSMSSQALHTGFDGTSGLDRFVRLVLLSMLVWLWAPQPFSVQPLTRTPL